MKALVTSGPTWEAIDPVRFIGNRSSGKQGHAIARALAEQGFTVTLVSGPVHLPNPPGVTIIPVTTAQEMLNACMAELPVDVAVCAAAVGDWRVAMPAAHKIKKTANQPLTLTLEQNPDILRSLAQHPQLRPALVIGFAAETEHVLENAAQKRLSKGCDWILANHVSAVHGFDQDENQVTLITAAGSEVWPKASKTAIAGQLARTICQQLGNKG